MNYAEFLTSKIQLAQPFGFSIDPSEIHPLCMPHQRDTIHWAIAGGRRGIFASFGLGKTVMQLEILRLIQNHKGGNMLVICPLSIKGEFEHDRAMLQAADPLRAISEIRYITHTDQITDDCKFYITNYERVRMGSMNPEAFTAVSMDEASILRSLETQTTEEIMREFSRVPYRFVCTATPSPNRFLELINYAEFLGIMDRGQSLTRFFERDSTSAGNLTLLKKMEGEFWHWMTSWALFITKPSDLGYDDTGYDLPPIKIIYHRVSVSDRDDIVDRYTGQVKMYADASEGLSAAAKEKRISLPHRIARLASILENDPDENYLIWHHLEREREAIQEAIGPACKSVYGSQNMDEREQVLLDFAQGRLKYLSTKPEIAGSGFNFQYHCHKAIFLGIDYKFNDFIQAVHRIYRFLQDKEVEIHIIHTDAEDEIINALKEKWSNHTRLVNEMTAIIRDCGLSNENYRENLMRKMFEFRREYKSQYTHLINNDSVIEVHEMEENSVDMILTSIPFGDHYEYSENYNCFGHNNGNTEFFRQMDFLTPGLLRILKPGRIAAIHVKDRIRYGYMNGQGFTTIEPFSDHTVAHFLKHGFHLLARITVTTDVVQENNQTYRLGWTEKCKDGTKMGAGLPEYLLIFRKGTSDTSNAYADDPVTHDKADYSRSRWQIDAHSFWKSDGNILYTDKARKLSLSQILHEWKQLSVRQVYNYENHVAICESLDIQKRLPTTFMAVPPVSNSAFVWDDITRMNTLNSTQAQKNMTKHICPLQLDLIQRAIELYTNKGDIVFDPFGGIFSVPYQAVKMGRFGMACELNEEYYDDGLSHIKAVEAKQNVPTLFDSIKLAE